jgi:hypothetical protein
MTSASQLVGIGQRAEPVGVLRQRVQTVPQPHVLEAQARHLARIAEQQPQVGVGERKRQDVVGADRQRPVLVVLLPVAVAVLDQHDDVRPARTVEEGDLPQDAHDGVVILPAIDDEGGGGQVVLGERRR